MRRTSYHFLFVFLQLLILLYLSFHSAPSSGYYIEKQPVLFKKDEINEPITLKNGVPRIEEFNNESRFHNYLLPSLNRNQRVYISISPNINFNVSLYNPSGVQFEIALTIHQDPTKYLGSWITSVAGDWNLLVNATQSGNYTYTILTYIPQSGYSEDSAISINETDLVANFSVDHERHFWEVKLGDNQNGTLFLKESTPAVLYEARITIYPEDLKNNPVLPSEVIQDSGSFNYSWCAFTEDIFIIEVIHKAQDVSPIGLYNISFIAEEKLWSSETAGELPFNQTINVMINQGFEFPKEFYFKFHVNLSRSRIFIRVLAEPPEISKVLEFAYVKIEELGFQKPIYSENERDQVKDGEFNITLTLNQGNYYLIITLSSKVTGQFSIFFEYTLPKPFIWDLPAIILSLIILIALPAYLIFLDSKGKWYRLNQWTLPAPLRETYKLFKNSFTGFFQIKEVPDESILVKVESLPLRTFALINFVESSDRETLVFSKRLRRRFEWIVYVLIAFLLFDILNFLFFLLFSVHFLPIYIPDLASLLLILVIPTGILVVGVLFVNLSSFITYSQIINRLSYVVQNYQDLSENEVILQGIDPVQASKSINYVRVLWNQAKHAFKEKNYELFVIKADAAVKNLLSTRFQQLVAGNKYTKPDFQIQATQLRKRGFDLPSDKKITHFRNLRNRIVHSSVTLDEKESVDCFAYYSTFITRLGLRPN